MPLAYIIQNLQGGQSARCISMGGYVEKSSVNAETGAYTLTWRKKDGTTTYIYTWTGTAWQAPSTTIPVDAEFFKLKNFCLVESLDDDFILSPGLADSVLAIFRTGKPFLDYVNRAIDYCREERKEYFSSVDGY